VVPAMIRKFVEGRDRGTGEVVLWGSGEPSREFLYVDDAARALLLAAERLDTSEPMNIGTGRETRIRDLAETIRRLTGFEGAIVWDTAKPDGQSVRYLDVSRARELLGFEAEVPLDEGLQRTIESFERKRAATAAAGLSAS
jgi:GDP-L-fucose synthase